MINAGSADYKFGITYLSPGGGKRPVPVKYIDLIERKLNEPTERIALYFDDNEGICRLIESLKELISGGRDRPPN